MSAQGFVWSNQNGGEQLLALNLDVLAPGSSSFGQLGSINGTNPCGVAANQGVLCLNGLATEFTTFDGELLALDITGVNIAGLCQALAKRGQDVCILAGRPGVEKRNHRHRRLLRASGEQPC
jgi:hypothetical protein